MIVSSAFSVVDKTVTLWRAASKSPDEAFRQRRDRIEDPEGVYVILVSSGGQLMNSTLVKDIATIVGVVIATGSLVFTAWNTSINRRTNRARFWLDLRKMFNDHDEVHRSLRPDRGRWAPPESGPEAPEDWSKVEAYMGLFEICEDLLASKLIDEGSFRRSYRYRIANILANTMIVKARLVDHAGDWKRFYSLVKRMGLSIPRASSTVHAGATEFRQSEVSSP